MVLGKLPVPGRPSNLDYNTARGLWVGVVLVIFFSHLSFLSLPFSGRWFDMNCNTVSMGC